MIKIIIVFVYSFLPILSFSQKNSLLYRYSKTTKGEDLYGFKNDKGKIIFPAIYGGLGGDSLFKNIIEVSENAKNGYQNYYLLRNGKKILRDSTFMDGDYNFDKEQEGFIRFMTHKPTRIGFLDSIGQIAIPNIYNYASPFRNGISIVLQNAKRACWGGTDTLKCEHLGWKDGEVKLINTKNEVLANNFSYENDYWLDWYSLTTNNNTDTNFYVRFKGENNTVYQIIDIEKQFSHWFNTNFKKGYSSNLSSYFLEKVMIEDQKTNVLKRSHFSVNELKKNGLQKTIQNKLTTLFNNKDSTIQYSFFKEDYFVSNEQPYFKKYRDIDGRFLFEKYPTIDVVVNYNTKSYNLQESFTFIRIDSDFKLIEIVIRK